MVIMVVACLVCIIFDIVTGIIKALKNNGLNSTVMRQGFYHKIGELLAVGAGCLFTWGSEKINLGFRLPLLDVIGIYIILTEIISVLENIGEINPELKELFEPFLEKMRGDKK